MLLYRFSEVVPAGVKVTVVADRGFADCNLFKFLEELGFGYVIRLPASYYVTSESGQRRLASQWVWKRFWRWEREVAEAVLYRPGRWFTYLAAASILFTHRTHSCAPSCIG